MGKKKQEVKRVIIPAGSEAWFKDFEYTYQGDDVVKFENDTVVKVSPFDYGAHHWETVGQVDGLPADASPLLILKEDCNPFSDVKRGNWKEYLVMAGYRWHDDLLKKLRQVGEVLYSDRYNDSPTDCTIIVALPYQADDEVFSWLTESLHMSSCHVSEVDDEEW